MLAEAVRPSRDLWRAALSLGLGCLTIFAFFRLRNMVFDILESQELSPILALQLASYAFGVLFFWIRYNDVEGALASLTRISIAGVFVYLLVEPPVFTLVEGGRSDFASFVNLHYWFALGLAGLGLLRPSFGYASAIYVIATRFMVDDISGYRLSFLDVRYMMEMAQFLSLAVVGVVVLRKLLPVPLGQVILSRATELCIAMAAVGLHLGNYFWSGYAKMAIGPTPLSWVLENATENQLLIAAHKGALPIAVPPGLMNFAYTLFSFGAPISNALVLFFQAAAILAVLRLNWLRIATLAYDALHIGIYVFGGLFFWPWIWNNVSVLYALRGQNDASLGWAPKLCCMIVIISGGWYNYAFSARLAWFDITDIRAPIIEARTEGSDIWHRVPNSFFMSHSYAMSHGYFGLGEKPGHYVPTVWASTRDYDRNQTSGTCPEPPQTISEKARNTGAAAEAEHLARFEAFIRAHHAKMLARSEAGYPSFYLRSHHHPSNPLLFAGFNGIDLKDIAEYRYLDTSLCMSISKTGVDERYLRADAYPVKVK